MEYEKDETTPVARNHIIAGRKAEFNKMLDEKADLYLPDVLETIARKGDIETLEKVLKTDYIKDKAHEVVNDRFSDIIGNATWKEQPEMVGHLLQGAESGRFQPGTPSHIGGLPVDGHTVENDSDSNFRVARFQTAVAAADVGNVAIVKLCVESADRDSGFSHTELWNIRQHSKYSDNKQPGHAEITTMLTGKIKEFEQQAKPIPKRSKSQSMSI